MGDTASLPTKVTPASPGSDIFAAARARMAALASGRGAFLGSPADELWLDGPAVAGLPSGGGINGGSFSALVSPTDSKSSKSIGGGAASRPGQSIYSNSRCKNYAPAAIFFTIGVSLVVVGVLIVLPSFPRLRQFLHIPDGHNEHLVAAVIFCTSGLALPLLALAVCVCRATPSLRKRQSADFVADAWLEGELAPAAVPAHYDCFGAANAHRGTILMLPGAGAPRVVLRAFAEELATQQRVIVADVPGQGSLVRIPFSLARCDRLLCRILEREFNLEPSTLLMRASATSAAAIGASARGGATAAAVAASGAAAGGSYSVPLPGGGQFTLNPAQLAALAAGVGAGSGPVPAMAAPFSAAGASPQGALATIRERPPSIPEDRSLSTISLAGAAGAALAAPLRPQASTAAAAAAPLSPALAAQNGGGAGAPLGSGSVQRLKSAAGIQMSAQLPPPGAESRTGVALLSPAAIEAFTWQAAATGAGLNSGGAGGSQVTFGWDSVSLAATAPLSPPAAATGSLTPTSPSAWASGGGSGGGIAHNSESKRGGIAGFLGGLRSSSSTAAGGEHTAGMSAGAASLNGPSRGAAHAAAASASAAAGVGLGGEMDAEAAAPLLSNEYGRGSGTAAEAATADGEVKSGDAGAAAASSAAATTANTSSAGPSVTVIAWGLSAYTAAYFAMRHPDVVAGIAAAGPIPDFSLTLCKRCAFAFCCSCGCNGRCCCFGTSPAPDVGPGWFPWSSSVRRLTWVAALSNLAFKSRVQTHPRCPAPIRAALLQQDVHVSVVPDLVSEIKAHRLLLSQLRLRSTLPVLLVSSRRLARATRNLIPAPAAALTRSHSSAPAAAALANLGIGVHMHDAATTAADSAAAHSASAAASLAGAGAAAAHGSAGSAAAPAYQGVVVSGRSARGVRLLLDTENAGDAQVRLVISHGLNDPMLPTLNPSKTRRLCAIFGAFAAAAVQHAAALRTAREREARMLQAVAVAHAAAVAQAQADAVAHALAVRKLSGASGGGGNGSGRGRSSRSEGNDRRGSSSGGGSSSFSGPSSGVGSSGIGGSIGGGIGGLGLMPAHSPSGSSVARGAGARSFGAVTSGGASFSTGTSGSGTLGSLGSSGMGTSIGQGAGIGGSGTAGAAPGLASALAGRASTGGGAGSVAGSVKHSVSFPGLSFDERGGSSAAPASSDALRSSQGSSLASSGSGGDKDKDSHSLSAGAATTADAVAASLSVARGSASGGPTASVRRWPPLRQGTGPAAGDSTGPLAQLGPARSVSRDTAATASPAFAALLAAGPQPSSSVLSLGGMWPAEGMSGGGMHAGWRQRPGGSAAEWDDEDDREHEHEHGRHDDERHGEAVAGEGEPAASSGAGSEERK